MCHRVLYVFRRGFLSLLTLFWLLLWMRNHLFPIIHAHDTNGIILPATRLIALLQLLLPEHYDQTVMRLDTTINICSVYDKKSLTPKVNCSQTAALLDFIWRYKVIFNITNFHVHEHTDGLRGVSTPVCMIEACGSSHTI